MRLVICGDELPQALRGAAGEFDRGLTASQIHHTHVAPEYAVLQPGAESLRASLLGGKALSVGRGAGRAGVGFSALCPGENPVEEAVAIAADRLLDAADVDHVAADADDHAISMRAGAIAAAARLAAAKRAPRHLAQWPRASAKSLAPSR